MNQTVYNDQMVLRALKASEAAYDKFAKGKGIGSLHGAKSKDELFEKVLAGLKKTYPYDTATEQEMSKLNAADDIDVVSSVLVEKDPLAAKEKVEFSAFKPLVDDSKWYGMEVGDPFTEGTIQNKMVELGYDPTYDKSSQRFWDDLRRHATNYERGNVVKDFASSGWGITDALVYPNAYNEAVKQAVTGQYDDQKLKRAAAGDIATSVLLPSASSLTVKVPALANPLVSGLASSGIEGAHQIYNYANDLPVNYGDIIAAGVASATIPAIAKGAARDVAQAGTVETAPFIRGFNRGIRGGADPLNLEREALKKSVIDARKISKQIYDEVESGGARGKSVYREGDFERGRILEDTHKKLRTLGFENQKTPAWFDEMPQWDVEKLVGGRAKASGANGVSYLPFNDDEKKVLNVVTDAYNRPSEYSGVSTTGSMIPDLVTYELNKEARDQMALVFPEKVSHEIATQTGKSRQYNTGILAGRALNYIGSKAEPVVKVNPLRPQKAKGRAKEFKDSDWFKKLKETDPEKAQAVERALIGL